MILFVEKNLAEIFPDKFKNSSLKAFHRIDIRNVSAEHLGLAMSSIIFFYLRTGAKKQEKRESTL